MTGRDAERLAEALHASWRDEWANRPNNLVLDALAAALLPVVDTMRWEAIAAWLHPDTSLVPCTWCHAQADAECTGPDLLPGRAHGCRVDDARALLTKSWQGSADG